MLVGWFAFFCFLVFKYIIIWCDIYTFIFIWCRVCIDRIRCYMWSERYIQYKKSEYQYININIIYIKKLWNFKEIHKFHLIDLIYINKNIWFDLILFCFSGKRLSLLKQENINFIVFTNLGNFSWIYSIFNIIIYKNYTFLI